MTNHYILCADGAGDRTMTDHNTTEKIEALAAYLDIDIEDIEHDSDMMFDADGEEYMVCTDEEADDYAADNIKESLWTFNVGFIIDHSKLPYEAEEMISSFCGEACEDANETIRAMITDMDEFIEDAIGADGRGHFMNSYDGEENEEGEFYIYRME